jgi:hypothetical protein
MDTTKQSALDLCSRVDRCGSRIDFDSLDAGIDRSVGNNRNSLVLRLRNRRRPRPELQFRRQEFHHPPLDGRRSFGISPPEEVRFAPTPRDESFGAALIPPEY